METSIPFQKLTLRNQETRINHPSKCIWLVQLLNRLLNTDIMYQGFNLEIPTSYLREKVVKISPTRSSSLLY